MIIEKTTIDRIKKYRKDYLNSLPEFQELFIEIMINNSDYYILLIDKKEIGYAIRNNEGILIEFYLIEKFMAESKGFFNQLLKALSITDIYCKSFDSLLLNNCEIGSFSYSVIGLMYRDYVEPKIKRDLDLKMEKANLSTLGLLLKQDDSIRELFETEQQLTDFILKENVFTFYKKGEFIGCGMVIRTNKDWGFCDLGVWVNPSKRGNAFGSQIIVSLREFAIGNKMKPSCGCAIDNIASQKTIEKSGFVSRYKMIHFKTK